MVKTSIKPQILRMICERVFIFLRTLEKTSEIIAFLIRINHKIHE